MLLFTVALMVRHPCARNAIHTARPDDLRVRLGPSGLARDGKVFPGASYEDLIRIANDTQPEELLIQIRQRAEREFKETIDQLRAQQAETPV